MVELKNRGMDAESQVPIRVFYKDNLVGEYFADLIVEKKVIVEIKTIEKIDKVHEAQILNYLKASGLKVGLLINFKHPKAEIKRIILNLTEGRDN